MDEQELEQAEPVRNDQEHRGFIKGALFGALAMLLVVAIGAGIYIVYGMKTNKIYSKNSVVTSSVEKKLENLKGLIDKYYLRDVDEKALEQGIYEGYLTGLDDPYSVYYDEEATKSLNESTSGEYSGIGAVLTQDADTDVITITRVYKDSPAKKAGIKDGDILYKVAGKDISGQDVSTVVTKVRGDAGSKVKITVLRGTEKKEVEVTATRAKISAETVEYKMKGKVAYIRISEFSEHTADQFMKAMDAVEKKGAKGMILDLRGNPGGMVSVVCKIADRLLPAGTIVSTKDKDGNEDSYTSDDKQSYDKPMVVLVDGNSASASEILSGALKDYKVATIVGTQTYGKGVIQQILDLGDGTSVKITVAEYFTPNGTQIQDKGVTPDVEVKYEKPEKGSDADNQLDQALEIVKKEISK